MLASRVAAAASQGARRGRTLPSFDPLGAQLYLWAADASTVTVGNEGVIEWANLGTAGSSLDAVVSTGAPSYASGSHLAVPSGCEFFSRGAATSLDMADGDDLDVVAVISSTAPNAQRFLLGGEGQTHFTLIPRWSGLTVFRVITGSTLQAIGASLSNDGTLYAIRGHLSGVASPGNDSSFIRTNDASAAAANGDAGAVSFGADRLVFFSVGASEFVGNCHALIAKAGGFSVPELAELTARVNEAFGLQLSSV